LQICAILKYYDLPSAHESTKYLTLQQMLWHVAFGHMNQNFLNQSGSRTRCWENTDQSYVLLIVQERRKS
jgi:hypothetical protein